MSVCSRIGKHGSKAPPQSPGPARYGETKPDIFKPKPPNYTLHGRRPKTDKGVGPGPAGYLPKLPHCTLGPGYSFGRRTINDPYITAADTMPCKNRP